ncbi:MAG: hypothetical protein J7576_06990, partial [Siphonobacter aquaeclarae]|nr:hypothetical protein [Siphonobacter aquaeclarae]
MNKPTQVFANAILALSMAVFSCQQQENVSPSKDDPYALTYIKSLGFKSQDIAKIGSTYFVQGDIMFSDTLKAPIAKGGRTEQYYYGPLIDVSHQRDIKIKINSNISSLYYQIQDAVTMWNNVASQGSNIGLRVVSSGTYDIEISSVPSLGTCGSSAYPSNGAPGAVIYIDLGVLGGAYSDAQKVKTVAHEIGHALGFVHTNWNNGGGGPSGIDVPGVGGNDPNSIMNGNQCNTGATTLSTNDKAALVALYPINRPYSLVYN